MPGFVIFLIAHWYLSFFVHTVFYHRYAAHSQISMSKFWERCFYVLSWLVHGVGYLSPTAYAVMHRLHHAYTDTEKDPHSPIHSESILKMYSDTKEAYIDILKKRKIINSNFYKNIPTWDIFDNLACSKYSRLFWLIIYIIIYWIFAPNAFYWLILPFQLLLTPFQGLIVNWFAHTPASKPGYKNFSVSNYSKNLLRFDFLFLGEAYHNNHHANPSKINLRYKWYEIDLGYYFICFLQILGITKIKKIK